MNTQFLCFEVAAGLCEAALQALRKGLKAVERAVLCMLVRFTQALDGSSLTEAMGVLVAGNIVKLTMDHMAKAGPDMVVCGTALFKHFFDDPVGRERLCVPGTMAQMMKWIAKWCAKVRISWGTHRK